KDHASKRSSSVAAPGEGVEHRLCPRPVRTWSQLKHHAATGGQSIVRVSRTTGRVAANKGGAIKIPGVIQNHAAGGYRSVAAPGEGIEHRFRPTAARGRRELKDHTASGDARINFATGGIVAA